MIVATCYNALMRASSKLDFVIRARGLTRTQAASDIGISRPYLVQILSEARKPRFRVLTRIKDWTSGLVDYEDWEDRDGQV